MKKQLLCGVAAGALVVVLGGPSFAADMPVKARPLAPAVFDWSGYYVGAHVGSGQARFKGTWFGDTAFQGASGNGNGILGGLQAGHNWQQNTFVYGWETDVSFMNLKNTFNSITDGAPPDQLSSKLNLLASLRGRLGTTVVDPRLLLYVTGGLGLANGKVSVFDSNIPSTLSTSFTKFGGVVGGGAEWAMNNNWSVRLEGLYYLMNGSVTTALSADRSTAQLQNVGIVRFGLSYKFAGG